MYFLYYRTDIGALRYIALKPVGYNQALKTQKKAAFLLNFKLLIKIIKISFYSLRNLNT